MISTLTSLKSLVKTKRLHIDFPVFRLHYQVTVLFILTFCLIVSTKILFGDPIDCRSSTGDKNEQANGYTDQYCWAKGTYTRHRLSNATNATEAPPFMHPGVPMGILNHEEKHYHNYYQYVSIILLVQAVLFYTPHYIWKVCENGTIIDVCQCFQDNRLTFKDYLKANRHLLVYINHCFNINKSLALKYYLCHVFMTINLILQVIWLHWLFNYQYYDYGIKAMKYYFSNSIIFPGHEASFGQQWIELDNPLDHVFPKITTCKLIQGSPTGDTDKFSPMCVLTLNIFYDKIFLILWFWFLILGITTLVHFSFITMYVAMPTLRVVAFRQRFKALMPRGFVISSSLSEIFILELIGNNLDPLVFSTILQELSEAHIDGDDKDIRRI